MKQRSRQWERRAKRLGMGSLGEAKFATRFGGFVGLIVAAMFLLNTLAHLLSQPWDLGHQGVEAIGIPAPPNIHGDRYQIQVGQKTYVCHRGYRRESAGLVTILHDATNPSRCRARDTANRLGACEAVILSIKCSLLIFALSFIFGSFAHPEPTEFGKEPVISFNRLRAAVLLNWAATAWFLFSVLAGFLFRL